MERFFVPNFGKRGGLVTVVTQDAKTKEVLMLAYANREAYLATLRTGTATYWSTSRGRLWVKGEESGNIQRVIDVLIDCDGDAVLYLVEQVGSGACHTGARSCFYRSCIEARQLQDAPKSGAAEQLSVESSLIAEPIAPMVPQLPQDDEELRFVLPTGSLSAKVRTYLAQVGYVVGERDRRGFCGRIGRIAFFERDRRTIPQLIGKGFDAGITGKDLVVASGAEGLVVAAELPFSRSTSQPTRWVLASSKDVRSLSKVRVGCELPLLAEKLLKTVQGLPSVEVVAVEGSEELAIADGLCDAVLVVTETGKSLQANGLQIVDGAENLLLSYPQIVAAPGLSSGKQLLLSGLARGLESAVNSGDQVLVTCDIPKDALATISLPAAVAPTLSPLSREGWVAAQVSIPRTSVGAVLALLKSAGANAIAVQELIGYLA